jgi:hypothetical protein
VVVVIATKMANRVSSGAGGPDLSFRSGSNTLFTPKSEAGAGVGIIRNFWENIKIILA